MKAVIMAAGQSTRTYPLTLTRPKPLLKVVNKPILRHHLDALRGIVDGVVVIVGYRQEMIRNAFGSECEGLPIEYVEQTEQRGTGHAVLQCAGRIDEPFLVINGDDLFDPEDLRRLAAADRAALAMEVADPRAFGIYEVDGDRVVRLVEKPKEVFSNLANIGAYRFTPDVFDVLRKTEPSERGEIEITSAVQALADEGEFRVVAAHGYWLPTGYPWHLLDANEFLLNRDPRHDIQGDVSPAAHVSGPVVIGPGTVIRPGVVIEGPVIIGRDCTVGPNAWLRPGATLGNGCRVGQSVEIKNSILFDGAAVPHLSYVGDSILGEKVNFGCGTVTANVRHDGQNVRSAVKGELVDTGRRKLGAIVGDHVHTGINTSILPGRKFWPDTMTLPGQVVSKDVVR
jgi:bifunctional UDP-N-acetylglucosamine pyrophosphorylase/glucosamine-1-phosphate N-acetyltransferase